MNAFCKLMRLANVGLGADDCKRPVHYVAGDVEEGDAVSLLIEALWALVMVSVPVGLFTLAIAWWAMLNGHLDDVNDSQAIGLSLKNLSKNKDKSGNDERNIVHKKWAKFGGGFYGIVAFFTYIVIEMIEITTLITNFGGLWAFIKGLNLDVIIQIFIEGIMNFVSAMVWPVFWMKRIDTDQTWMWFVAAYAGYLFGLKLVQKLKELRLASGKKS
jgi:nitrogen fixation-related uncharacterized protein